LFGLYFDNKLDKMSGSKAKKHSKSDQIPKPISIKKEKMEEDRTLHPMTHYIDDRLELVKQIFGTLKPKTVMNLAPEFLKVRLERHEKPELVYRVTRNRSTRS